MLAVQESLHLDPAALTDLRDTDCEFAGCFRRHLKLYLPLLPCFRLLRSMRQYEFDDRQARRRMAQWINRGQSCTQPDRVPVHP